MPTLMAVPSDLKHLFDTFSKCRTRAIRLYRIFVRSNARAIEQRYYRTVIRHWEAAMSALSAIETAEFDEVGTRPATPLRLVTPPGDEAQAAVSRGPAGVSGRVAAQAGGQSQARGRPQAKAQARPQAKAQARPQGKAQSQAMAQARPQAGTGPLRLTRRGRIVVVLLAAVLATAAITVASMA